MDIIQQFECTYVTAMLPWKMKNEILTLTIFTTACLQAYMMFAGHENMKICKKTRFTIVDAAGILRKIRDLALMGQFIQAMH